MPERVGSAQQTLPVQVLHGRLRIGTTQQTLAVWVRHGRLRRLKNSKQQSGISDYLKGGMLANGAVETKQGSLEILKES